MKIEKNSIQRYDLKKAWDQTKWHGMKFVGLHI